MPRAPRIAVGGVVYHVLNRANARMPIFHHPGDYEAFERILAAAHDRVEMRTLDYCLMPNHWHLVLWPRGDGDLSEFLRWVTLTHTQRWHTIRGSVGGGHLYQGRYKSFPVATDRHFLTVCRYVERNPARAGFVSRAEDWRWGSLFRRLHKSDSKGGVPLAEWPLEMPRDWLGLVNQTESESELTALRRSVKRGCPYGGDDWVRATAGALGLESTLRPRGRPRTEKGSGTFFGGVA